MSLLKVNQIPYAFIKLYDIGLIIFSPEVSEME